MIHRSRVLAGMLAAAIGGAARGQDADAPLKGPVVRQTVSPETLVETDFQGHIKRLEIPPEEAALGRLDLDEAARNKVQRILRERAAILDKVVVENIGLLLKFNTARQAGDRKDQALLLGEFSQKLTPLLQRGALGDELKTALTDDQKARFDSLVNGYWDAVVAERMNAADMEGGGRAGRKPGRAGILARERLAALGQEIKRSYERSIGQRVSDFDSLLKQLDLRPEQEGKVRSLVTDYAQRTKLNPNTDQKRDLIRRISQELDAEQQRRLLAYVLGRKDPGGG